MHFMCAQKLKGNKHYSVCFTGGDFSLLFGSRKEKEENNVPGHMSFGAHLKTLVLYDFLLNVF